MCVVMYIQVQAKATEIEVEGVSSPDYPLQKKRHSVEYLRHIYENDRRLVQTINCPAQISGYEYEVLACKRALEKGLTECPEMPHEHTLYIMRLFDEIRKNW